MNKQADTLSPAEVLAAMERCLAYILERARKAAAPQAAE
jgi:hypothetical protein